MIAVFCETPYQTLNALNLVYSEYKEDCILCIYRDMYMSDNKYEITANNIGYVKGVYYVKRGEIIDSLGKRILRRLSVLFGLHHRYLLQLSVPHFPMRHEFNRIITMKYATAATYLLHASKSQPEVIQVEEGIGEYIVHDTVLNDSIYNINNYVAHKYVSAPELYENQYVKSIKKAPYLSENADFLDTINHIFGYRRDICKYRKYIWFEEPFAKDYDMPEFDDKEEQCFDVFKQVVSIDDLTIKLHPRSVPHREWANEIYSLAPWECYINELTNLEDRVLISVSSTALLTPKLLANKEPYVIFLFKIFKEEMKQIYKEYSYYDELLKFIENIKGMYKDKNRVIVPNSVEELKTILLQMQKTI